MDVTLAKKIKKYRTMYVFLIPAVALTIIFSYTPMIGVIMAFQNYNPIKGFFGSEFVGVKHFIEFLNDSAFYSALKNTLGINLLMIIIGFPLPIVFALMINEIKDGSFKRITQSISYLPHFISWVVIAGMAYRLLEEDFGSINLLINFLGGEKVAFFREADYFWGILVTLAIWKELGWNAIIYLAALSGIDSQIYEAATVDGAGRFKKLIHITLPGIRPTISLMFILTIGSLATSVGGTGLEAIMNLQNAMVSKSSTTIDYYIYFQGLKMNRMSFAAAIGLSQSIIALGLVFATNSFNRKKKGYGAF